MDSDTHLFPFLFLLNLSLFVLAKDEDHWCFENGNYTTNDTYHTNLKTLLSSFPSSMGDSGFHTSSLGKNSNRVYALALCKGDIQPDVCRSCVQNASVELITSLCPNSKQAVEWVEGVCMLRYSNEYFFSSLEDGYHVYEWSEYNVTSPLTFKQNLRLLLDNLFLQAASGGSVMKVSAGSRKAPGFVMIFALLQCTPDISEQDCMRCLMGCAHLIPECCQNSIGIRISSPSCNLQYQVYPFYNITRIQEVQERFSKHTEKAMPLPVLAPAPTPVVPPKVHLPSGNDDNNRTRTIVIIVVLIVSSLLLFACLGLWLATRRKKKAEQTVTVFESADEDETSMAQESMQYDFNKIREATNDFSIANKLGEGGFGVVYKGVLQNGQEIAVKRLVRGSSQGDSEFRNEVMLLAKLQHRNLVRLIGFAQQGKEQMLIYEYIKNASLDRFIFDPTKSHSMDWNRRFKIIGGVARGLLYMHEDSRLRVIHRDLKPSNILLDANMNPKIADFGTARLCDQDATVVNTRNIAGTRGYMAPEYIMMGQISIKADVFSFGVLVLEIISGQRNSNYFQTRNTETVGEGLQSYAMRNWHEGTIIRVIDPVLRSTPGCFPEITRCVHIALLCIEEKASDRPTMASVVLMLSSSTVTLPLPSNPSFFEPINPGVNASLSSTNDLEDVESFKSPDALLAHPNLSPNDDSLITELHPR